MMMEYRRSLLEKKEGNISLGSLIVPAGEDTNTKQERISAERFADNILILCDKCH